MKPVYYFIHDNSMQWFSYIVEIEGEPNEEGFYDRSKVKKMIEAPAAVHGPYLSSILSREMHFGNRKINNLNYYGWTLSKGEFERLEKLISLLPSHQEYLRLQNL